MFFSKVIFKGLIGPDDIRQSVSRRDLHLIYIYTIALSLASYLGSSFVLSFRTGRRPVIIFLSSVEETEHQPEPSGSLKGLPS